MTLLEVGLVKYYYNICFIVSPKSSYAAMFLSFFSAVSRDIDSLLPIDSDKSPPARVAYVGATHQAFYIFMFFYCPLHQNVLLYCTVLYCSSSTLGRKMSRKIGVP